MTVQEIQKLYEQAGGEFYSSPVVLSKKLAKVKALVFDWDGVWHSGRKSGDLSSFSEVDSMGLNMLRFGYYLRNGTIPITIIITGENNVTAFDFARREHLDAVFYKAKDKGKALDFICNHWNLTEEEILFAFDDILDLGMAKRVGVKYLINRTGSALFHDFLSKKGWYDYKSSATGDLNGVREICELSLGLLNNFAEVVEKRMDFHVDYSTYWNLRNKRKTVFFTSPKGFFKRVLAP